MNVNICGKSVVIIYARNVPYSNFLNPAGTGCGRISASVFGRTGTGECDYIK